MTSTPIPEANSEEAKKLCEDLTAAIEEDHNPVFEIEKVGKYTVMERGGKYAKRDLPVHTRLKLLRVYSGKREPLIFVFGHADHTPGSYTQVEIPYKNADSLSGFAEYVESLLDEDYAKSLDDIREEKSVFKDTEHKNWDNPLYGSW